MVALLPRHTAVFTRPVSATTLTTRNDDRQIVGCRNGPLITTGRITSDPCHAEESWTGEAKGEPPAAARENPPAGVRLAFHSTIVSQQEQETPSARGGWRGERASRGISEGPISDDATAAAAQSSASSGDREEPSSGSSRARSCSTSNANILPATEQSGNVESEHVRWRKPVAIDGNVSAREHLSPPPQGYAYSLGGAFHNQRVASVRFIPGVEERTARMGSTDGRRRTGMRLVTGEAANVSLCLALGSCGD